jgi:hypothetical protein
MIPRAAIARASGSPRGVADSAKTTARARRASRAYPCSPRSPRAGFPSVNAARAAPSHRSFQISRMLRQRRDDVFE